MKRIILVLFSIFCLVFLSLFSFAQERGMRPVQVTVEGTSTILYNQSHALLIGACNYTNGLKPLPGVSSDIQALKTALENNGFNVKVVMDPDNVGLVNAFNDFIGRYGSAKENRLLFYFAGHGYTRKIYSNEIGYLLPTNCPNPATDPAGFQLRAMPMGQIELFAQQIQAKHALFLFDACFSGAVFAQSRDIPGIINYKTTQPVRQFITSGSADETVPDQSIFRRQFIAALTGEADLNKDSYITGTELGDFLQTTVVNYSRNSLHPQFGKIRDPELDKGDFVFVLNKTATPTGPAVSPTIVEERTLVQYGKLDLTTEIAGSFYLDGTYMKQVNANTALTLNNLTEGQHTVKISGDETIEKTVTVSANQTTYLMIDKKRKETSGTHCPGMPTFTDPRNGQVYPTVQIGTQCWMQKNMNYQIGRSWCYDNKESNCNIYGRLYDWGTALKVCPVGWHLPSDEEWNKLATFLGGNREAGAKMKESGTVHWTSPNANANNSSGFNTLPGGARDQNFSFYNRAYATHFWSCTSKNTNEAWERSLTFDTKSIIRNSDLMILGFSVRCLKD